MCAIFGIIGKYNPKTAKDALSLLVHCGGNFYGIVEQEYFFAHQ